MQQVKQAGHSESSQYCTSTKQQCTQGKKPPSNRRTTDVETTTFISIENRRVEEPIHFTTYRQPRGLSQGNKPFHLTPSHFRRQQRNTRGHTLAGRHFPTATQKPKFQDYSCSPVDFQLGLPPKNLEFPDRSCNWAC